MHHFLDTLSKLSGSRISTDLCSAALSYLYQRIKPYTNLRRVPTFALIGMPHTVFHVSHGFLLHTGKFPLDSDPGRRIVENPLEYDGQDIKVGAPILPLRTDICRLDKIAESRAVPNAACVKEQRLMLPYKHRTP